MLEGAFEGDVVEVIGCIVIRLSGDFESCNRDGGLVMCTGVIIGLVDGSLESCCEGAGDGVLVDGGRVGISVGE